MAEQLAGFAIEKPKKQFFPSAGGIFPEEVKKLYLNGDLQPGDGLTVVTQEEKEVPLRKAPRPREHVGEGFAAFAQGGFFDPQAAKAAALSKKRRWKKENAAEVARLERERKEEMARRRDELARALKEAREAPRREELISLQEEATVARKLVVGILHKMGALEALIELQGGEETLVEAAEVAISL
jgi:acyl-CoA reductase-like NAD-dependent aldehyde dehydrogenase